MLDSLYSVFHSAITVINYSNNCIYLMEVNTEKLGNV